MKRCAAYGIIDWSINDEYWQINLHKISKDYEKKYVAYDINDWSVNDEYWRINLYKISKKNTTVMKRMCSLW